MDFMTIVTFALGLVSGIVVALRVIAPKTKTTLDDKALKVGEEILEVGEKVVGFETPN